MKAAARLRTFRRHPIAGRRNLAALVLGIAIPAVGCAGAGAGSVSTSPPSPATAVIAAVSRSNPGRAARAFLDACGITNFAGRPGTTAADGIAGVTRIGLIPHAFDYARYIPHLARGPGIPPSAGMPEWDHLDRPLWLAQYSGVIIVPMSDSFRNGICGMVDGDPTSRLWIDGDSIHADGSIETLPPQVPPTDGLPALAP
jgi:hypothetical protein